MLKTITRAGLLAAVAFAGYAQESSATVYVNKRYCGGGGFSTCAAVQLDVTGTTVSLRVWNLSGNTAGSYGNVTSANTVFQGIGLYNVPAAVNALGAAGSFIATSGPARAGDTPGNWRLRQNGTIGVLIDFGALSAIPNSMANGIASGCANNANLPTTNLYLNPCSNPVNLADFVTFTFQVNQHWDATNAGFSLRTVDALSGRTSECLTATAAGYNASCFEVVQVVPEPMTMGLLATGLIGLGGVGFIRRRKAQSQK